MSGDGGASGAYRLPATVHEVPNIRRLGMHFEQGRGWIEHICTCPEPCHRSDCVNEGLLARSAASADSRPTS